MLSKHGNRICFFFLCMFMVTSGYAGSPLWTFDPLTATTVAVPANGTATV